MKYSAHCFVFTDRWSDDRLPLLDTACELGLDGFEIAVGDDMHFSPKLTRRRAESLGLELAISPGGLWPSSCDLSQANSSGRKQALDWHKKQVDTAAALGATAYTGALYGHPGVLHHRILNDDEYSHVADGLNQLAEYGQRNAVQIVIEPMSHFRTHVANTAEQAMRLIALADHPNLLVLLDTYHLVTETRDYAEQIRATGGKLWGIHACESDRGVPGGGLVPWQAVFSSLRAIQFDGWLVFESYNSSVGIPAGSFAFERGMLHNVCPDGSAFVRSGLKFLKAGLQK